MAVVVIWTLLGCAELPAGDASRPDIVLVSIDSLRADHLSSYGYERPTSPFLDSLAAGGLRFTHARAASPWTLPSHLTMLTGLWPTQHHVVEDDLQLADDVPEIQEALHAAGWATGGFVSALYVAGSYGFARGFDTYSDHALTERTNLLHTVHGEQVVDEALDWVKKNGKGKPVFLFVHLYDVHYPYLPPAPYDTKFDRAGTEAEARYRTYPWYLKHPLKPKRLEHQVAQYDESIAYVDAQVARLHAAWEKSGRPANWIVTADHGEEFGERGSWGHAHTLYPEALSIPLVVSGPGIAPAVRGEHVGTIDLAPTIAAMAGVSWKAGDGVDLRGPIAPRVFLAETSRFDSARLSIADGSLRFDDDLAGHSRALYDTVADPQERHDLSGSRPEDVARLRRELLDRLGQDWMLDAGTLRTSGHVFRDGDFVQQPLTTPGAFGLYPPDATVTRDEGGAYHGIVDAPADGPVRYSGPRTLRSHALDAATKEQLEQLGYVQGEEDE